MPRHVTPDPREVHANSRNCPLGGAGGDIMSLPRLYMMNFPPEVALSAAAHALPVAGEAHTSSHAGAGTTTHGTSTPSVSSVEAGHESAGGLDMGPCATAVHVPPDSEVVHANSRNWPRGGMGAFR
jgi:hypothetical protein